MAATEKSLSLMHNVSREDIDTIKRTVAPDATDVELKQFVHLAIKYNLDPMAREIYFSKMGGRPSFIVGRDGYLKIAMMDLNYCGLQSFVVKEGDHFEIDVEGSKVIHRFGAKRGEIIGAWAMARHRTRPPVIAFVDFKEYKGNSPIWGKYPSAMIQKVAEVFVLRRQFNIAGLVSQEEIGMPEEARFGGGQPIDTPQPEPSQHGPIQPDVIEHRGENITPGGDTLTDMRQTNAAYEQHLKEQGRIPEDGGASDTPAMVSSVEVGAILRERPKHTEGWQPIMAAMTAKGYDVVPMKGLRNAELVEYVTPYLLQLTRAEAEAVLKHIKALPFKSATPKEAATV